jgi:hypothetical protein
MLLFAFVLVVPTLIDILPIDKIKDLFKTKSQPVKPQPQIDNTIIQPKKADTHGDCDGLVDVVKCWEHLVECCESQGMVEAAKQLKGIFPFFVVKSGGNNEQ